MPWIPFYADEADWPSILGRLNSDAEIAIIRSSGRGKWIARAEVSDLPDGAYCLWHIPGGPLPAQFSASGMPVAMIPDPFRGWTEQRRGANPSIPFLGGVPAIFELHKAARGVEASGSIGLSSLGWIGNRYRSLGLAAHAATELWWRRMQRWVKQVSVRKIPRWDAPPPPPPEIWAFPSAYQRMEAGVPRDANSHL